MSEEWDQHVVKIDGVDTSIAVDLSLIPGPGDPARPGLARIRIHLRDIQPSGLAGEREQTILDQIRIRLSDVLIRMISAAPVGIVTRNSTQEHYFYTPNSIDHAGLEYAVQQAMQIYPHYPPECDLHIDVGWSFYRDSLYPQAMTRQLVQNRRILTEMKNNGDVLTAERPVFHWALFRSDADRKSFVDDAIRRGFRLADNGFTTAEDAPLPFTVELERTQPAVLNMIDETTITLSRIARTHRGRYDGWETSIIRKTDKRF